MLKTKTAQWHQMQSYPARYLRYHFSWQIRNLTLDRRRKLDDFQSKVLYRILNILLRAMTRFSFEKQTLNVEVSC